MYTICKGELQTSYMMYGILWKEMDFDFMARCKPNTFRKELQSLLQMNTEHLDGLESAPCSGMLPSVSADTKIKTNKQINKNPFNLTPNMLFLGGCFKKKVRCHSKEVKEEVQIVYWPLHPPLSLPPTYR